MEYEALLLIELGSKNKVLAFAMLISGADKPAYPQKFCPENKKREDCEYTHVAI